MSIQPRIQTASLIPRRVRGHESASHLRGRALPSEGSVLLGRGSRVHIRIGDATISRRHARLDMIDGRCWLFDLGSANGSFVNGRRVCQATPLHNGDLVRFGRVVFELSLVLEVATRLARREEDLHEAVTVVTSRADVLRQLALAGAAGEGAAGQLPASGESLAPERSVGAHSAKILPGPHLRRRVLRVA